FSEQSSLTTPVWRLSSMMNSITLRAAAIIVAVASILQGTPQSAESGTVQGTVKRAGSSEVIAQAQIRLEGGPADPRAVQELIRTVAGRGIAFTPRKMGT